MTKFDNLQALLAKSGWAVTTETRDGSTVCVAADKPGR